MARLADIVEYCDSRIRKTEIPDFPGAKNGLQVSNNGEVTKIGAAVDAGLVPFEEATMLGIDFIIVHHGLFWNPPIPVVGPAYSKLRLLIEKNLAVYGAHLPLDCHPEIGNNAILAEKAGLKVIDWFLPYEGIYMGAVTGPPESRTALRERLESLFPSTFIGIEYGPDNPKKVGILTGSGSSAIPHLVANGIDTFITGELKQEHFNVAQEQSLNLYLCGHYATEVFGVQALAQEVSEKFDIPYEFVKTECPL